MNFLHTIYLFAAFTGALCADEPTQVRPNPRTQTPLQRAIVAEIPAGWEIARSPSEMVLTLRNARFLNSISLPPVSEDTWWREYSWTADYVITIRITPALSQEEYTTLIKTREALRHSRMSESAASDGRKQIEIDYFVESTVPLPLCRIGTDAIWISTNDRLGQHWVRPSGADAVKQKVIKLLLAQGSQYQPAQ